jgi:hypothetical protein
MSEEILKLLGELGATAQDVAARLGAERIKARKGASSFQNPIIRYVKRHLDSSGPFYLPLRGGVLTLIHNGRWYAVELPAPVRQFLDRFHASDFPSSKSDFSCEKRQYASATAPQHLDRPRLLAR